MRPLHTAAALLVAFGVAACSGQGGSSLPSTQSGSGPVNSTTSSRTTDALGSARTIIANSAAPNTYTAPFDGVTSSTSMLLLPNGVCGHIPATNAPGYAWPAMLNSLKIGTTITLSGTGSYSDAWSQQNNCPTGGFVVSDVTLGNGTPAPNQSPAPSPGRSAGSSYTYTAPWGYFTALNTIAVRPQGACRVHIPSTPANGFSWPGFLRSMASGPLVTVTGTPSYNTSADKQIDCPSGGIVATKIALVAATSSPAPPASLTAIAFGAVAPDYHPQVRTLGPYAANSTINQRICTDPCNPRLTSNSSDQIGWLFSASYTADSLNYGSGGQGVWFAKLSDPKVRLVCNAGYNGGNQNCPLQNYQLYLPSKAVPECDPDKHMIVIEPSGDEVDIFIFGAGNLNYQSGCNEAGEPQPPWYTGETIQIGWGSHQSWTNGTGWDGGAQGGPATVSGGDLLLGYVFAGEIGGGLIDHALAYENLCEPGRPVYPGNGGAGLSCNGKGTNAGSDGDPKIIAGGARLWLDTSDATINSYSIPNGEKVILHALHQYGMFNRDTTGGYNMYIYQMESRLPGDTYNGDTTDPIFNVAFGRGSSGSGLPASEFQRYVQPHLHVLDPCVNNGYPDGNLGRGPAC